MTHAQIDDDRPAPAAAPRDVSLLRPDVCATVAGIVSSAADLTTGEGVRRLTADLQRYTEDLLTAALGSYKPVVDDAGNLLFLHLQCAWPQWGEGNQPPRHCRRCAVPTGAWTAAYARSNVDVRRNRQSNLATEPALVAALRGAFGDADLDALAADLANSSTDAGRRLAEVIDTAAGGM